MSKKRETIADRMSAEDKFDLYHRKQTVRDLAKKYEVSENYLSHALPDRAPKQNRKLLANVRKLYVRQIISEVHSGRHSIYAASNLIHKSERTVFRLLAKYREENA